MISRKLLIKSRNQNILSISEMNRALRKIPFPMMYSLLVCRDKFRPSKIIPGGGGTALRTTSISYSAKVCVMVIMLNLYLLFRKPVNSVTILT